MSDKKAESKRKRKEAKRKLKKTGRIAFGAIGAAIAVVAVLCVVMAISLFKSGTNTFAAIVLLIVGAAGLYLVFKIVVKIKDSVFDERMKDKYGDMHSAPSTVKIPQEDVKKMSENQLGEKICGEFRGKSGGNNTVEYRISDVSFRSSGLVSAPTFTVSLVWTRLDPVSEGSLSSYELSLISENESRIGREITNRANEYDIRGVKVHFERKVN